MLGDERQGIQLGRLAVDLAGQRPRFDDPVLELVAMRVEPVAGVADHDLVVVADGFRREQPLVGELGQRLGDEEAVRRSIASGVR